MKNVVCGGYRRFILGPLLFLINVNDLHVKGKTASLFLFPEDNRHGHHSKANKNSKSFEIHGKQADK